MIKYHLVNVEDEVTFCGRDPNSVELHVSKPAEFAVLHRGYRCTNCEKAHAKRVQCFLGEVDPCGIYGAPL